MEFLTFTFIGSVFFVIIGPINATRPELAIKNVGLDNIGCVNNDQSLV